MEVADFQVLEPVGGPSLSAGDHRVGCVRRWTVAQVGLDRCRRAVWVMVSDEAPEPGGGDFRLALPRGPPGGDAREAGDQRGIDREESDVADG